MKSDKTTNRYLAHQELIRKFKFDAQKKIPGIRIFDAPTGLYFTKNGSPIKVGTPGQADCFALIPSKNHIIYISLEFKTGNAKLSKKQKIWQDFITQYNGLYLVVRENYENTINIISDYVMQHATTMPKTRTSNTNNANGKQLSFQVE